MMSTARTTSLLVLTTAVALGLSGCGKGSQTGSAPAGSGTVSAPAHAASAPAPSHTAPAPAASSHPAAASTAAAAPAAAPAPAAVPASSPVSLALGSSVGADHRVIHTASRFKPSDKSLYISVSTKTKGVGGTLNAKWLYLEGSKPTVTSSVSQLISADMPTTTTFTLHNPDLWPQGRYRVDISLDGKSVGSETFEVR